MFTKATVCTIATLVSIILDFLNKIVYLINFILTKFWGAAVRLNTRARLRNTYGMCAEMESECHSECNGPNPVFLT